MFDYLPCEITEEIISMLPFEDLVKYRKFCSDYFNKKTQFNNFENAIKNENLPNIKWLTEKKCHAPVYIIRDAAEIENLKIIKHLYKNGCGLYQKAMRLAVKKNNMRIMKWLFKNNCRLEKRHGEIISIAIENITVKNGSILLTNIEWLYSIGASINGFEIETFITSNKDKKWWSNDNLLKMLNWYKHVSYLEYLQSSFEDYFAICDISNLVILNWFLSNGCVLTYECSRNSIFQNGDVKIINWLICNGCPITAFNKSCISNVIEKRGMPILNKFIEMYGNECINEFTFEGALMRGDTELIEFLMSKNCAVRKNALSIAIKNCEYSILKKIILYKTFTLTSECYTAALKADRVPFLMKLMNSSYKYDTSIILKAAEVGNLCIIMIHLSNFYKYDLTEVVEMAVINERFNILEWIKEYDYMSEYKMIDSDFMKIAVINGNFYVIKWGLNLGYSIPHDCIDIAINNGKLDMIKWLVSIGYCVDNNSLLNSIKVKDIDIVKFIYGLKDDPRDYFKEPEGVNYINTALMCKCGDIMDHNFDKSKVIIEWLYNNGFKINQKVKEECIYNYIKLDLYNEIDIENIVFLKNIGCDYSPKIMQYFIGNYSSEDVNDINYILNDVELVRWVVDNGCPYTESQLLWFKTLESNSDIID